MGNTVLWLGACISFVCTLGTALIGSPSFVLDVTLLVFCWFVFLLFCFAISACRARQVKRSALQDVAKTLQDAGWNEKKKKD